jgi:hypothetical protein
MMPFGSLAPGILLPILAFAYMLYFGACALNKGFKGAENSLSEISPEKTQLITKGESSFSSYITCCLQFHKCAKQDVIKSSSDNPSSTNPYILPVIKIPEIRIIYDFNRITLFSRPPPVSF